MSSKWELLQKAKSFILARQFAYLKVFNGQNPHAETVLMDLAKFCRAHEPTFHADPRLHAMLEGRREVWLRIERNLKLNPDQIWALYNRGESNA